MQCAKGLGSLFLAIAALYPVSRAHAQYRFDSWTADNGLPQNIIRGIRQTRDGYLWLATLDGLARFDGVAFTVFNKANSPGIGSTRFSTLYEDPTGDLWMGTEGSGVTRFHHGAFTTYTTQVGLPHDSVRAITGDDSGNLWVLSGGSVAQWQPSTGRFLGITPREIKASFDTYLWEEGGFWASDDTGLHLFENGRFVTYALPPWLPARSVWGMARSQDGAIWLEAVDGRQFRLVDGKLSGEPVNAAGHQPTVTFRDGHGNSWTMGVGHRLLRFMIDSSSGRPQQISFSTLREDREGNLWLATEGQGLYRARRQSIAVYTAEQRLVDRDVYANLQDRDGAIWIGAWHGGISRLQDGKFTNYTTRDGLPTDLPTALYQDREGRLWAGAHGGLRVFLDGRFREPAGPVIPPGDVVQAIHQDREGTFWFGTSGGLVRFRNGVSQLLTAKDGIAGEDVRVIVDGLSGDLWFGGYGGLTLMRNGRFTHWTERDGLPSNTVRAIYIDAAGVVWIGTYDGGLARFHNGRFTRYTTRDGLFSDGVFQILEDTLGNFWMSCNRGIFRISKQDLDEFAAGTRSEITSIGYGRSDGLLNVECNGGYWPAGIRSRDGKLWFPTQDGVAVIDPQTVPHNPQPPPVVIQAFLLDHVPVPFDRPMRLAPKTEHFEIQYTALSFINSTFIQFKYKLEGLDSHWIDAGQRRTAYYSHVPPGHYVFTVIARNSDGVWNNTGRSLDITMLAPYYRTAWFEALAMLAVMGLAGAAWRYRIARLEHAQALQQAFSRQLIASQENERKRIAGELHDSLGQRLVVIKNLALFFLRAQGEAAANGKFGQIEEISAETSLAIDETREIAYNLRPFQLDRLGLTKAIEGLVRAVSAASGILFTCEVDNIDDVFPEDLRINFYRIVQESVNNIVKHSKASEAGISVQRTADRVVLAVRDNGQGFVPAGGSAEPQQNGFGLSGMAERAQLLSGVFTVHSTPTRGASIRIEIHLGKKSRG